MCGGRFSMARRSCISVSPVRTAVRISGISRPRSPRHLQNLAQRAFEVFLDVVAQSLQRRDVEHFGAVVQIAGQRLADQAVDAGEKRGQSLARAGRGGDQRRASGQDVRPALLLRLGRRAELAGQTIPATSGWAQAREGREDIADYSIMRLS